MESTKKEMEVNIEVIDNGFLLRFNWEEPREGKRYPKYEEKKVYCKSFRKVVANLKEHFGQK